MSAGRFLSMFSGIGGLDEGLERAGWECGGQVELDQWRSGVLAAHWPEVYRHDDVATLEPPPPGWVDLVCGGFPCQDVSVAGRRAGLAGERSGLFFELCRVLEASRPRWVLLENVIGLRSSRQGADLGKVLGTLAALGYGWCYRVLDARYFGVPQRRRRVFIVGRLGAAPGPAALALSAGGEGALAALPCSWQEAARGRPARAGGDGPPVANSLMADRSFRGAEQAAGRHFVSYVQAGALTRREGTGGVDDNIAQARHVVSFHLQQDPIWLHDLSLPLERGKRSQTIGLLDGIGCRRLSLTECERLMAFPDGWTDAGVPGTSASRRWQALGDAVVVNVAEWLGRRLAAVDAHLA